jgi:hypothetical protein
VSVDNFTRYRDLRKSHRRFHYHNYRYHLENDELVVLFDFRIDDRYWFRPSLTVDLKQSEILHKSPSPPILDNLVFHIGMIELISYWKCCCPPIVDIHCGKLPPSATEWWKDVYFKGMGEFFHTNGIETGAGQFMEIRSSGPDIKPFYLNMEQKKTLVPVGGGKDSAVTLSLLKKETDIVPFLLNPTPAMLRTIGQEGLIKDEALIIRRKIDPLLLQLNAKGYLNGHTPFSALLAFDSLLAAYLTNCSTIALSNESSANEPTIPGTDINHQYSKSYDFERKFRRYVKEYISKDLNYFSFLRPLNELQIASIFSRLGHHHTTFRSCNVGSKEDRWCGRCPKCLFTWVILSPFLDTIALKRMFNKNLWRDDELVPILDELTGQADEKPFECIGTTGEVNAALSHVLQHYHGSELPPLLKHYKESTAYEDVTTGDYERLVSVIPTDQHFLDEQYFSILKKGMAGGKDH